MNRYLIRSLRVALILGICQPLVRPDLLRAQTTPAAAGTAEQQAELERLLADWQTADRRRRRVIARTFEKRVGTAEVVPFLIGLLKNPHSHALGEFPQERRWALIGALEACRRFGIAYPFRLPPNALIRFMEARRTRKGRHPKKALVIMPKYDPNRTYYATDDNIATLDQAGPYDVWYAEAGSKEEFIAALQDNWDEPLDLIVISGHGTAKSIRFGIRGGKEKRLTTADEDWLMAQAGRLNRLRAGGKIILRACNTGQTFGGSRSKPFKTADLDATAFEAEQAQGRPVDAILSRHLSASPRVPAEALTAAFNELMRGDLRQELLESLDLPPDVRPMVDQVSKAKSDKRKDRAVRALNRALLEAAYPRTTRPGREAMAQVFRKAFPDAAPGWIQGGKRKTANPQFFYRDGELADIEFRTGKGQVLADADILRA